MIYLVANWKQNFDLDQSKNWLDQFLEIYRPNSQKHVIIAGSYIHLPYLAQHRRDFSLAAQNISAFSSGPHTGQIGAEQLNDLVGFCLIGHSEARSELGDTDQVIAAKARLLQQRNITPIVCLDRPYLESQITALQHELLELNNLILAYEPLAAIGTGRPEEPRRANEIAFKIKSLAGKSLPVIYGGSIDSGNVADYLSQEFISGVLPGGASLDPKEFATMISRAPSR